MDRRFPIALACGTLFAVTLCAALATTLATTLAVASPIQPLARAPLAEVQLKGSAGPAVLLIPCMSCRWKAFQSLMTRNADRYRFAAVTLPGMGGTPVPDLTRDGDAPLWHRNAVAQLSRLIDSLGFTRVTVVGHSFGGQIALELAAARPDAVVGVLSLDGPVTASWLPATDSGRLAGARSVSASQPAVLADPDTWAAFNLPGISDVRANLMHFGWFMSTDRRVLIQYWRENYFFDPAALIRDLKVPVLQVKALSPNSGPVDSLRAAHLNQLETAGIATRLSVEFLAETRHHVHLEKPVVIDSILDRFTRSRR